MSQVPKTALVASGQEFSDSVPLGIARILRSDLAPAVMGILNITPDSFSGDGLLRSSERSGSSIFSMLKVAEGFLASGADWLDVGAESTRPGALPLTVEEERARLLPAVEALLREFPHALVSVDTRSAPLALEAFALGVRMLNDVSGKPRVDLWRSLGAFGAFDSVPSSGWIVLMHNGLSRLHKGSVEEGGASWQPTDASLSDLQSVLSRLRTLARACEEVGVARKKIILDAGLGFAKTLDQNLSLLGNWNEVSALGYPTLMGASRKSFLGSAVASVLSGGAGVSERLESGLAACAMAMDGGVRILRVHDVRETVRFVRALHAMRLGGTP